MFLLIQPRRMAHRACGQNSCSVCSVLTGTQNLTFLHVFQVQHERSSHLENKQSAALKLPEVNRHLVTSDISPTAAVLQPASWPTLCKCSLSLISVLPLTLHIQSSLPT